MGTVPSIGTSASPIIANSINGNDNIISSRRSHIMVNKNSTTISNGQIIAGIIGITVAAGSVLAYHRHRRRKQRKLDAAESIRIRQVEKAASDAEQKRHNDEAKKQHDREIEEKEAADRTRRMKVQTTREEYKLDSPLVGRQPLLDDILAWIRSSPLPQSSPSKHGVLMKHERMWLTIGSAGTGKSAISVGFARLLSEESKAGWVQTPFAVTNGIRLIHHRICVASEENGGHTKATFIQLLVAACYDAGLLASKSTYTDLNSLFVSLNAIIPPLSTTGDKLVHVLMIDGLDESPSIASLLTRDTIAMIPVWFKLVCTSRPVPGIPRASLSSLIHEIVLDASVAQTKAITAYVNDRLPLVLIERKVSDDDAKQLSPLLINKSGGLFMYARYIIDDIERKHQQVPMIVSTMTDISSLPPDLYGYYLASFQRHWPLVNGMPPSSYKSARVALENNTLHQCTIDSKSTGCTREKIQGVWNLLEPFIRWESRWWFSIHKSFDDWLALPTNPYHIQYNVKRTLVSNLLHEAPPGFVWSSSAPRFYKVITEWLGCEPTIDTTKFRNVSHFGKACTNIPESLMLAAVQALEMECKENSGGGFWKMADIFQGFNHSDLLFMNHFAVMPERYMTHNEETKTWLKLDNQRVVPLDWHNNRITHMHGHAVSSPTDVITELELVNIKVSKPDNKAYISVTVVRDDHSTTFGVCWCRPGRTEYVSYSPTTHYAAHGDDDGDDEYVKPNTWYEDEHHTFMQILVNI